VLYQKFGYKPKGLVVITAKHLDRREVVNAAAKPAKPGLGVRRYSSLEEAKKKPVMQKIRRITNAIWRGMDVAKEIEIVDGLALGDTLLLEKGREVIGFAVCHMPPNSEAPHGAAYVKFPRHRRAPQEARAFARPPGIGGRHGRDGPAPAGRGAGVHVLLDGLSDTARARIPSWTS
jgi:hypothetical protein